MLTRLQHIAAAAVIVGLTLGVGATAKAQMLNVTGVWQGVNYTSQVPGPHKVVLSLSQTGQQVIGYYWVSTGVYGTGQGLITSPNSMTMTWTNTSPDCPGTYNNLYIVTGNKMTWSFTGNDCLGIETGYGNATRLVTLGKRIMKKK